MMSKSSTTTKPIPNPHPGRILDEEFLQPFKLSQNALARALEVPRRINEIVKGLRGKLDRIPVMGRERLSVDQRRASIS